jgi:hypothetical protein
MEGAGTRLVRPTESTAVDGAAGGDRKGRGHERKCRRRAGDERMNGLNTIRASEQNRQLLHAAELDRARRRNEFRPRSGRLSFDWMAALWSLRSRAARAERRAIRLAGLVPSVQPAVAHPLAVLAANAPAQLPVENSERLAERRFAPVADRVADFTSSAQHPPE